MKNSSKIGKTPTYKIELHVTTQECNELVELLSRIGEERISKYEAMEYINCSKATFERLVLSGKIPQGRKQAGFKEKFWYKSEILQYIKRNSSNF